MTLSTDHHWRNNNTYARSRDAMLRRLLEHHPATASIVVGIKLFPTKKKALRRLNRLVEKGEIKLVGTVLLHPGRPEQVYARSAVKVDQLRHEVLLTQLCLKIDAEELRRGDGCVDPYLLPDAEFVINGQLFYLELDRGTMTLRDLQLKRFSKYRDVQTPVLWVCSSADRVEAIRTQSGAACPLAAFTTLDDALVSPHRDIWIDAVGRGASLPRRAVKEG